MRLVASELAHANCQTGQAPLQLDWQQQGQEQLQGQWNGQGQQPLAKEDIEPAEAQQASLQPLMRAVIHGGRLPMRVQQEDMQAVLIVVRAAVCV